MLRLLLALILSTLGGTFILHYLKNFLLKERTKFHLDWDGLLERLGVTYIMIAVFHFWMLIPLIVLLKAFLRLTILGFIPGISQTTEAGGTPQKVLLKAELAFDLLLSPAFAILIGVIFK
ncbi:hypothetical protein AMJ44_04915 [candidate division WOR-1 bacterium DG_54_3]|uniref:Uncharacterized protein n=1 Tax=candidate division WOR-1 bacterium DG_54_3 TaxID=1703775 RepID=A0A0S7Y3B0_UNCSA|nr:MAG: hypothetical protein AMJ44_04915 [candidate division WOR-1 bacterium DG_54_3]